MQSIHIIKECVIERTPRILQMESIFDVPLQERSKEEWNVELPLSDRDWNIGMIVGPSGCGKTIIAKKMFKRHLMQGFNWEKNKSIIDNFPKQMSIKDIVTLLSSVGFSSPPSWVRPYHVLSTGEQFRVNMARMLAGNTDLTVVDEFTSVIDRTVAQIGSHAIAKTVRKRKQKFIAVTCHYDIINWLQPDWIYCPANNNFKWRRLRQRPEIELSVLRVHYSMWSLFQKHHYMNTDIHRSSRCFMAIQDKRPVAFAAIMAFPHYKEKNIWRGHRLVCLPDFQGVGIGRVMADFCGSLLRGIGKRFIIRSSHPAEKERVVRDRNWIVISAPKISSKTVMTNIASKKSKRGKSRAKRLYRAVISAEYIGEKCPKQEALRIWNSQALKI